MKTIEERIEELYNTWPRMDKAAIRRTMVALAADLQAEKEKEVAELRKKHHEYVNLSLAKQKEQSALIDEVKRVLGAVAGCKLFYEESMDIDNHTTDDVNSLLTRLE